MLIKRRPPRLRIYLVLIGVFVCCSGLSIGVPSAEVRVHFEGQLSTWARWFSLEDNGGDYQGGIRYLPSLSLEHKLNAQSRFGFEMALNGLFSFDSGPADPQADLALYRATAWFATARTETVIGLQKIAFGPATLLRPLRWFDRIDPKDPLGFTNGQYGARFRYFTLDNTNAWIWCLYPNIDQDDNAADELPTEDSVPQWGGRVQVPLLGGEMALSANVRRVDTTTSMLQWATAQSPETGYEERRVGLDGRWDIGVGLWFEMVFQHQTIAWPFEWRKAVVGGIDYTFDWGNGLYALVEQMAAAGSQQPLGWEEEVWASAVMLRYPLNVMDAMQFIGAYGWDDNGVSAHLSWQRTYDRWIINAALFHYPTGDDNPSTVDQPLPVSGSGAAVMLIFNH